MKKSRKAAIHPLCAQEQGCRGKREKKRKKRNRPLVRDEGVELRNLLQIDSFAPPLTAADTLSHLDVELHRTGKMSDDGLMLNFAAPSAKPVLRRASGKRHHERPRVSSTRRDGPDKTATANASASPSASTLTTTPAQNVASPSTSMIVKEHRVAEKPVAGKPVAGKPVAEKAAPQSARPGPESKQVSTTTATAARRGGFISSLFTGNASMPRSRQAESSHKDGLSEPTNAPSAGTPFGALGLDPLLVTHLQSPKMSIEQPTGIQRASLPFLLSPSNIGRDALLHAQTGSGKTLSFLLPIIQSFLPLCETSWIDRSCLGTVAIILAPTRELAHQIYEVAERLCSLNLATAKSGDGDGEDEDDEGEAGESSATRRTRWIIPGILSGGATRNHEKSRLRKGLPLIVATPGRLLDHLRNTSSLDVCRSRCDSEPCSLKTLVSGRRSEGRRIEASSFPSLPSSPFVGDILTPPIAAQWKSTLSVQLRKTMILDFPEEMAWRKRAMRRIKRCLVGITMYFCFN